MKKLITFLFLGIILILQVKAQSPQLLKYQTVIRNNSGAIVVNKFVAIRATIIANSTNGSIVYQEVHNIATNEFGIANLNIGDGTVQIGNFNNIYWGNNIHFLKIEIDLDNSTNFVFISSTKLLSVPYALYAAKTSSAYDNSDKDSVNELQIIQKTASTVSLSKNGGSFTDSDNQLLSITGNIVYITNGNTITLPSDYDTDSLNEIQNITKNGNIILLSKNGGNVIDNDNQTLSISGNQLQISNGNSTTLAGFVDMDGDSLNEIQTLSKHGDTLVLSENGGSIRIPNLHNLSTTNNGTNRTINITEGSGSTFNIADNDNDSINELQTLTYSNDTLNLSKGNYVKLPTGFNGQYSSLTGKPNLSTVATTGSYNNLSDTIIGSNIGDIKYWNGNAWVILHIGQPNQFLQLNALNLPEWKGNLPTLTTNSVSLLTNTIATLGGNISSDGGVTILARGICWDTIPTPTTSKNKTYEGIGTGVFTTTISGLIPAKTYYARAYAINIMGTAYGNEVVFTTLAKPIADIDGNVYDTVHIGSQIWMKQNLKTTHYRTGDSIPNVTDNTAWSALTSGAYCYHNNDLYGSSATYGSLYNFYSAADTRNLCPSGWHLPSDLEWTVLTTYLGGESIAGGKLKEAGLSHWNLNNTNNASNSSGFTALPSSHRLPNGNFWPLNGQICFFWTSTETNSSNAYCRQMYFDAIEIGRGQAEKKNGYSVRCLMNSNSQASIPTITTNPISNITPYSVSSGGNITNNGGATVIGRGVCWDTIPNPTFFKNKTSDSLGSGNFISSITGLTSGKNYYLRAYAINSEGIAYGNEISLTIDIDGNVYEAIQIGSQIWLKQNLKTTKYKNGNTIPYVSDNSAWTGLTTGARCYYNNLNDFGFLYNGYAVNTGDLCPLGWHVLNTEDFDSLLNYLGDWSIAGGKLKATSLWAGPNTGATNETGFTALPGGIRQDYGYFGWIYQRGYWAISTGTNLGDIQSMFMYYNNSALSRSSTSKSDGLSVRCLKGDKAIISKDTIFGITHISAVYSGNISNDWGHTVTQRGICWNTSPNPTISLTTKTNEGGGNGNFTSNIMGLAAGITYYVRAYAINKFGVAYGNELSFTTSNYNYVVYDSDGNGYDTLHIGTQVWMKENLRTTRYNNGNSLNYPGTNNTDWQDNIGGAYAWYNNDEAYYKNTYGALYNGYAVSIGNLCPTGWHIPSDAEWTTLTTYLGGEGIAGGKLKATTLWSSPNTGATNESRFSAVPSGTRIGNGLFINISNNGYWWSTTWVRKIDNNKSNVYRESFPSSLGFSIRCIKN